MVVDQEKENGNDDNDVHLIEGEPEHLPGHNCPLSKGGSPEVGGITAMDKSQLDVFIFANKFLLCC